MSQNAGGLIRWPVYAADAARHGPAAVQGVSELIKRIAFLRGLIPDPLGQHRESTCRRTPLPNELEAQQ